MYEDDIPEEVKKRRNNDLLAIQNQVSLQDHLRQVGKRVSVLVEGPSKNGLRQDATGPIQMTGRTPSDHIVVFDGNPRLAGAILDVDIHEATSFTLFGTVATQEQITTLSDDDQSCDLPSPGEPPALEPRRIGLPLV